MKKLFVLAVLSLFAGCMGKKTKETGESEPGKTIPPTANKNKNEIRTTILDIHQKTTFAGDFKRGNCEYGKVSIKDKEQSPIYNFAPAIICKAQKRKYFTSFDQDWGHYEFKDALRVGKTQTLFAVADYGIEGGMESVPVFRSLNGGKSWAHVGDINKPNFSAQITHLSFSSEKVGKVLLVMSDTEKYFADTKNGGISWSAPYMTK